MVRKFHLLVGLVGSFGVAYLCHEVILLFGDEILANRIDGVREIG
jgi:hypothetical protein